MDFKVGMVVICTNTKSLHQGRTDAPPLKLNGKYVVQGVKQCSCGGISLDVGLTVTDPESKIVICHRCWGKNIHNGIWWCSSVRFSPEKTEEETKTEYKVVEIDKSLKEKRKEVIHFN